MSRQARNSLDTSFFHTIIQGINGEYIFQKEQYIIEFLRLLHLAQNTFQVALIAYCIMSNHAHLLLHSKDITLLSKFMHFVNTLFAEYYNTNENRYGPVFRDRFLSEPITSQRYLIKCINYIHLNPVKAKMVEHCEDYPFSSYQDFIHHRGGSQAPVLLEVLGQRDFTINSNNSQNLDLFMEIDISKEDILTSRLNEFLTNYTLPLNILLKDKLKELILYLKAGYKINYSDISKFLKISRTKIFYTIQEKTNCKSSM